MAAFQFSKSRYPEAAAPMAVQLGSMPLGVIHTAHASMMFLSPDKGMGFVNHRYPFLIYPVSVDTFLPLSSELYIGKNDI